MKSAGRRSPKMAIWFAGIGLVAGNPAVLAGVSGAERLETIIVTATRLEKPWTEIARSMAVISGEEIDSIQPQSIPQILAYQPNITVSGGPRAASQGVNVRGLTGSKILQTVDGARQSFESGHRPSYFLDPDLVQRVEAIRGPAASLWGSGALGGVVAQSTIDADNLLEEGQSLGGFLKTGYNDNGSGSNTTAALAGKGGDVALLLSAYYRDSDDLEMGNGEKLLGSGAESYGGLAKLTWELSDSQELELSFRGSEWDGSVPANGSEEIDDSSNFLISRDMTSSNARLEYNFDADSDLVQVKALAYSNSVDIDERRPTDGRKDTTSQDELGLNLSNLSQIGNAKLLLGAETYKENFKGKRGGLDRPVPPDADTTVWSAFALAELPLAEAWNLELGWRYDDFETRADNLNTRSSDSAASPSVALVWDAADWLALSLRYDRAFRAPSAEELYSSGYHFCIFAGFCNSFVPNPDLDSEEAANTEFMARMVFPQSLGADVIHLEVSVFENKVENFIEQFVVGPFFFPEMDAGYTSWRNVDKATLKGGEFSAAYVRGPLSLKLGYGLVRGEDDSSGRDLTNIPADTIKMDAAYQFDSLNLMAGLRFTYASSQNRTDYELNVEDTTYDSYGIADIYASWAPAALPGLRVDLNVNNIEDKYYRQAWEQLYQAGREIMVSARYQF